MHTVLYQFSLSKEPGCGTQSEGVTYMSARMKVPCTSQDSNISPFIPTPIGQIVYSSKVKFSQYCCRQTTFQEARGAADVTMNAK